MASKKKRLMSDDHKAALAEGRSQSRAVKNYLEALSATKPKRGRKRNPESMRSRLTEIDQELPAADPLTALNMRQERIDLRSELNSLSTKVDIKGLEDDFVQAAKGYGLRKGIGYGVWREAGVPVEVLKRAGVSPGT
ncbi:MAG: hypothetical protein WKF43_12015 [Acidimicrobiales bacterium]